MPTNRLIIWAHPEPVLHDLLLDLAHEPDLDVVEIRAPYCLPMLRVAAPDIPDAMETVAEIARQAMLAHAAREGWRRRDGLRIIGSGEGPQRMLDAAHALGEQATLVSLLHVAGATETPIEDLVLLLGRTRATRNEAERLLVGEE